MDKKQEQVENILFEQLALDKKLFVLPDSIDDEPIKFAQKQCDFLNKTLDSFDSKQFHLTILLPCKHAGKDFIEFKVVRGNEQKLSLFVTNPHTKKSVDVDMETFFNLWIYLYIHFDAIDCTPTLHVNVNQS